MRIAPLAPLAPLDDPSTWFARPLGTLLRTFEDALGRTRTRQTMLVVADPRGVLLSDTTLEGAIEHAQWITRDAASKSPALAVLQAAEGEFLLTTAYHGPDLPLDLDARPFRRLDLDALGTTSPLHTAILGNLDAPYFRALVTSRQVILPEFD